MNLNSTKNVFQGAAKGRAEVIFEITAEESQELRDALAIVNKYEKAACSAVAKISNNPRQSDWCEFRYQVKNDKVIVVVEDGSCG